MCVCSYKFYGILTGKYGQRFSTQMYVPARMWHCFRERIARDIEGIGIGRLQGKARHLACLPVCESHVTFLDLLCSELAIVPQFPLPFFWAE